MRNWDKEITEVVNIFKKCNYGETIRYDYISSRIGIEPNMSEFMYVMSKARTLLIEKGKYIKTLSNFGYRVLYPNEIPEEVFNKYIKSGMEKYQYGINVMANTSKDLLNEDELLEFKLVEELIKKLYVDNSSEIKNMQFKLNSNKFKELTE